MNKRFLATPDELASSLLLPVRGEPVFGSTVSERLETAPVSLNEAKPSMPAEVYCHREISVGAAWACAGSMCGQ